MPEIAQIYRLNYLRSEGDLPHPAPHGSDFAKSVVLKHTFETYNALEAFYIFMSI